MWRVLRRRLYYTSCDVDHLKQRLVKEWRHFSQDIIDRAVQSRTRHCVQPHAGARVNDGDFDYKLQQMKTRLSDLFEQLLQ